MNAASQIAVRHFGKCTVAAMKARGIEVLSLTVIPAAGGDMPLANGATGYNVNDNGCGRVWTHAEVVAAAKGEVA